MKTACAFCHTEQDMITLYKSPFGDISSKPHQILGDISVMSLPGKVEHYCTNQIVLKRAHFESTGERIPDGINLYYANTGSASTGPVGRLPIPFDTGKSLVRCESCPFYTENDPSLAQPRATIDAHATVLR